MADAILRAVLGRQFDVFSLSEGRSFFNGGEASEVTVTHHIRLASCVERAGRWVAASRGEEVRTAHVWLEGKVCVFSAGGHEALGQEAAYLDPVAPGRYRLGADCETWSLVGAA